MVEAAYRLFCERGFAVPLTAIATEADVAVQTLYFTFTTKLNLLSEALQYAVHGDDRPEPPHERAWFTEMQREQDPRTALLAVLEGTQGIYDRLGRLAGIVKTADPEISALWRRSEDRRYDGMGRVTRTLLDKGTPRVDTTTATDAIFVMLLRRLPHLRHRASMDHRAVARVDCRHRDRRLARAQAPRGRVAPLVRVGFIRVV